MSGVAANARGRSSTAAPRTVSNILSFARRTALPQEGSMRVRIEFDSRRGRVAFRCGVAAAATLAVCVPLAYASQVGTLITFSPGQKIRASDMNFNFNALKVAINDTDNKCGNLTTLTTTAKGDLVSAVNEVNGKIPTGTFLTSVSTDGTTITGNGTSGNALTVVDSPKLGGVTAANYPTLTSGNLTIPAILRAGPRGSGASRVESTTRLPRTSTPVARRSRQRSWSEVPIRPSTALRPRSLAAQAQLAPRAVPVSSSRPVTAAPAAAPQTAGSRSTRRAERLRPEARTASRRGFAAASS
jgi:hypothetical protein